jgi:murein L,D-transpeptidase YafK
MKTKTVLLIALPLVLGFGPKNDFLSEQKKYERVKQAYTEKLNGLEQQLKQLNLDKNNLNILITTFKEEQELVIYAKTKTATSYKKLITYSICASSGTLGPKTKQGDGQVPEGFYHIDRYNPSSLYYLSLVINYPNQSDKTQSTAKNLGGDIFIHGECVTIGCLPMTNDKIKEIYIYALQAKHCGQNKIPVYVFPFKMSAENAKKNNEKYKSNKELLSFWNNLKSGYDNFHSNFKELNVAVDKTSGEYRF